MDDNTRDVLVATIPFLGAIVVTWLANYMTRQRETDRMKVEAEQRAEDVKRARDERFDRDKRELAAKVLVAYQRATFDSFEVHFKGKTQAFPDAVRETQEYASELGLIAPELSSVAWSMGASADEIVGEALQPVRPPGSNYENWFNDLSTAGSLTRNRFVSEARAALGLESPD